MKALKVKFQNKKRKPHVKTEQKQQVQRNHDHGPIEFLLREDTDAQQAKNQLRKASEQVFHLSPEHYNEASWSDELTDLPFYWLDQMTENQLKNIVKSNTGNSQVDLSPETKHSIINCLSQGQLKARNQITSLRNYQNMQKNLFAKKSSISYLRTEKSEQKNPRKIIEQQQQNRKVQQEQNALESINLQLIGEKTSILAQQMKNKRQKARNFSTAVMKRSRVILITPKIKQHPKQEQGQPVDKNKKNPGVSTVYFKVPDFNSKQNLKRAMTVHCETNSKESLHLHKKNFYLKKTNTICVVEKQLEEANKCISLSNYKTMGYAKKSKLTVSYDPGKKSSTQFENAKQLQVSGQNLKENLNRLSMQKAAKTMMLRQQFERLRKLLKKETIAEFKIDQDSPIRITKL